MAQDNSEDYGVTRINQARSTCEAKKKANDIINGSSKDDFQKVAEGKAAAVEHKNNLLSCDEHLPKGGLLAMVESRANAEYRDRVLRKL